MAEQRSDKTFQYQLNDLTVFFFLPELEALLKRPDRSDSGMGNDAKAQLQGQDSEDQDNKKSKRGKSSLVIVITGQIHKTDCLNNFGARRGSRLNY